ncbi:MAG TPA: HAD family phosphatase [Phycisphaerae bacterium]|nr:HAD family phosphatase [Phycisphaerae bacterium]
MDRGLLSLYRLMARRDIIARMIRAIIFDCDGVIADTEPLHYQAFNSVLAERDIRLSQTQYFQKYVGLNDPAVIRSIFADLRLPLDDQRTGRLLEAKNAAYLARIARGIEPLPGVTAFVARASERWPLALCSGARRVEIETILRHAGLSRYFPIIVSSDDVTISKPDPAGFLRTLELLQQRATSSLQARGLAVSPASSGAVGRVPPACVSCGPSRGLSAAECLVIEDSAHGIAAAKSAGMRVLAVQSGCSADKLSLADVIVPDLRSVTDDMIAAM